MVIKGKGSKTKRNMKEENSILIILLKTHTTRIKIHFSPSRSLKQGILAVDKDRKDISNQGNLRGLNNLNFKKKGQQRQQQLKISLRKNIKRPRKNSCTLSQRSMNTDIK